jgi:hypothetical protein
MNLYEPVALCLACTRHFKFNVTGFVPLAGLICWTEHYFFFRGIGQQQTWTLSLTILAFTSKILQIQLLNSRFQFYNTWQQHYKCVNEIKIDFNGRGCKNAV